MHGAVSHFFAPSTLTSSFCTGAPFAPVTPMTRLPVRGIIEHEDGRAGDGDDGEEHGGTKPLPDFSFFRKR